MFKLRLGLILLVLALALLPLHARAQGANCAKKILEYIGKPLAKGAAERAGGLVAEYFAEKFRGTPKSNTASPQQPPPSVSVGSSDFDALRRRGLNDCQINAALNAMYGGGAPSGYSAQAHCGATNVTGTAHGLATPQEALRHAVYDCQYRGGVPECCRRGARVLP